MAEPTITPLDWADPFDLADQLTDEERLVRDTAHARTAYYLDDGKLWGFGLFRRGTSPCR